MRWGRGAAALLGMLMLVSGVAGCGDGESAGPMGAEQLTASRTTEVDALDPCAPANLTTVVPAQFTVAVTDRRDPALLSSNDRAEWEGREATVVYSLAEALGFDSAQVVWLEDAFTPATFVAAENADVLVGQVTAGEMASAGGEATVPFGTAGQSALVMGVLPGNPLRTCMDKSLIELESNGQVAAS